MHQKKSEAQIGEDSIVVSADFNPFLHLRQLPPRPYDHSPVGNSSSAADHGGNFLQIQVQSSNSERGDPDSLRQHHQKLISTPHKRPLMNSSLSHSQTFQSLESLSADPRTSTPARFPAAGRHRRYRHLRLLLYAIASTTKSTLRHLLRRLRLRLLLLSFPCLFLVLGGGKSTGDRSLLLGFLSAISFSSAIILLLIISFNLFPFPSLRLLLSRSSSYLLPRYHPRYHRGQSPPPVLWSIGSDPTTKTENLHSSGSWVQIYSNGDVYEGEFHHGKCSGSGVYYYYMSGRYEGDWIDDKYDGYGVETWAKGSRYRGQYRQGLRHGFGIYRFYTGDLYAGEWSSGQSHGCGVHTCEDGSRYVGEFKWGVKHGLGHYHFRNGDTYSGEYFADKMHGFGVYRYANGHRYEGAWHEGRRQGLGMYTFRNGETQSGYWEIGVLATTSTHNNLSSLPVAVNHSKVLNVVQEARCASEKAFNVPRVDERVNKAVAAANKAANAARVAAVKAVQKQMHGRSSNVSMP